ncbi:MAG: hypothetical protein V3S44_11645 [Alphaproteobacteria bacterium]
MTDAIAARPPANVPVPHARDTFVPAYDGEPDIEDISFRELWDDPDKGMTFSDFLDIINPLQHIPVISTIYRLVTGDTMSQGARMVGGMLFGGVTGLLASGVVAAFEEATGRSVEGNIIAMFNDDEPAGETATPQVASAAPAATVAPAAAPAAAVTASAAAPVNLAAASQLFTARPPAGVRSEAVAAPGQIMAAATPEPLAAPKPGIAARTAPVTAAETASSARETRAEKMAAERQRITETIARARNQQSALLIASLMPSAAGALTGRDDDGSESSRRNDPALFTSANAKRTGDPFQPHPFMLPPGASPAMVSRAMEQALNKYQQGLQARGARR